jgi:hypothetical protein
VDDVLKMQVEYYLDLHEQLLNLELWQKKLNKSMVFYTEAERIELQEMIDRIRFTIELDMMIIRALLT